MSVCDCMCSFAMDLSRSDFKSFKNLQCLHNKENTSISSFIIVHCKYFMIKARICCMKATTNGGSVGFFDFPL